MKKKIKILYIIDILYNRAGSEMYLFRLLTNLDKEKFEAIVCPLEPLNSPMIQWMRENGIVVEPIDAPKIYNLNAIKKAYQLIKLMRRYKIDIVQTIHLSSDIFGTLTAWLAGVPVIVSSRRDMGFNETKRRHRLMRRLINLFVDKVITNSEVMKQQICRNERVRPEKILTIYNGLDAKLFNVSVDPVQQKKKLGLEPNKSLVTVISNIRPIKGLEFFIEAAATILQRFANSQFIVVGGDATHCDSYKEKLNQLISSLKLSDCFFFLGSRAEIPEILSITDVFVLPSLSEGFSNTLIEAMAAGKAVVATDVGGNPEAVVSNATGFIVPAKDSKAIASAVMTLLADKPLAEKMGQAGRLRVEKCFSITQMVGRMEMLYLSLLKKRPTYLTAID